MLMPAIEHGVYRHRKRVCTGSWLWEKKNPSPHRGLEPASILRLAFQWDALPTDLSLPIAQSCWCTQQFCIASLFCSLNRYLYKPNHNYTHVTDTHRWHCTDTRHRHAHGDITFCQRTWRVEMTLLLVCWPPRLSNLAVRCPYHYTGKCSKMFETLFSKMSEAPNRHMFLTVSSTLALQHAIQKRVPHEEVTHDSARCSWRVSGSLPLLHTIKRYVPDKSSSYHCHTR